MHIFLLIVLFLAALLPPSQAQETLNITTYYPSPNGVFRYVKMVPQPAFAGACGAASEGTIYMDSSIANHTLTLCHYNGATASYQWVRKPFHTNCVTKTCASAGTCTCDAGYYMVSGSCSQSGAAALYETYPSSETTWNCRGAGTVTTTVRCCR